MTLLPTGLAGVYRAVATPATDARGSFVRTWAADLSARLGRPAADHEAEAHNPRRHTLRGLHYQAPPWCEGKRVRCVRGAVWDVVVDLRTRSPTFLRWEAFPLSDATPESLYLPPGVAHGYLTLRDDTVVAYAIDTPYHPEAATGVRWDDPRLGVAWPAAPALIGERDRALPNLGPDFTGLDVPVVTLD